MSWNIEWYDSVSCATNRFLRRTDSTEFARALSVAELDSTRLGSGPPAPPARWDADLGPFNRWAPGISELGGTSFLGAQDHVRRPGVASES